MQSRENEFNYKFLLIGPKSEQILYNCQTAEDKKKEL